MEDQVLQIAQRIKELRQIIGKSTEEMAEITNISVSDYENSEAGLNDFSFTFLHKCAKAFSVDITELLTGETPKLSGYSVVRSGEGLPLERRKGFKYNHLASYFKNKLAEPFLVKAIYDADAEQKEIPLAKHDGEEFDYVLKGELKVSINNHIEYLKEGDTIYYNSATPHGMIAAGGRDCEFLAVVIDAGGKANIYEPHETIKAKEIISAEKVKFEKPVYENFVKVVESPEGSLEAIDFDVLDNYNFAYDVVDVLAKKCPDKTAMVFVDNDLNDRKFSFSEISRYSSMTANYFKSMGIKKGDRVMLVLKRHYQFWFSIIALHKLGAVAIPATNLLVQHDLEYRFNAAGVSAVICTGEGDVAHQIDLSLEKSPTVKIRIMAKGEREGWGNFDKEIEKYSDVFERVSTKKDEAMLMFFTSGTTGYPKIAAHSYTYSLGHFITAKYWHNVDPNGIHFTISDTGWGKALWGKLYGQWLCEAAIFVYDFDKFDAHLILPMFKKYNITTFCAPPTMYRFFIKEDLSKYDLSSLKYATIAGEALNPEVFQQFYNATGLKLMEGFGQTETTLVIANLIGMEPKPGSMGRPSPLYDVDLVNSEDVSTKVGEVGEIVIRTDRKISCGMFCGYYLNKEKTDEAWHNDVYHTGDMAWRDEDGYFWYVGRTDDLIKSSGYRIGPFEIESVIMELPYVLECAVTGAPDPIRGQIVKATIILTKNAVPSDALKKEVQEYVKSHTAPYKYPRIVEFVDELPKTISGKIKRVDIRKNS